MPSSPGLSQCGWDPQTWSLIVPALVLYVLAVVVMHPPRGPPPPGLCWWLVSLALGGREISMGQGLGADTEIPHGNTGCFLKSRVNLCVYFPQLWPGLGRQWSLKTAPHPSGHLVDP